MKSIAQLLLITSFFFLPFAVIGDPTNGYLGIQISPTDPKGPNTPRTPAYVPIYCYYHNGTLDFSFYEDLGEVEIIITSVASGSIETTVVDTSIGHTIIGVPTIPGNYEILIETPITSYFGCYSL